MLLASIVDQLRVANWQRAADEDTPPPTPIPRPGITPTTHDASADVNDLEVYTESLPALDESGVITGVETPIDELNAWLGWD